jgi:ribose 5-phosphate isomerase B
MREVKTYLDGQSLEYKDFGTYSPKNCDYPEFAARGARAGSGGECNAGIFICGTGIGVSIAANKVPGIRAAHCTDSYTAELTRRHNDANVLVLGARITGVGLAMKIVETFLNTGFDGGRHSRRVSMLDEIDRAALKSGGR